MEVAAGTSDACVIDLLMAGAMIGEGTSYPNLTYTVNLNEANGEEDENYVVGFRKGSDLTEAFNDFLQGCLQGRRCSFLCSEVRRTGSNRRSGGLNLHPPVQYKAEGGLPSSALCVKVKKR